MIPKLRSDIGEITIEHRGNISTTCVGDSRYNSFIENIENEVNTKVGYIPAGFEHRPDLISNVFYGTPAYWWLIMLVNNINDPFEQLNAGDRILIPTI